MWNLSFGDGSWHNTTDSAMANTTHEYPNVGNYTATLSVSERGYSNTSSINISVLGTLPVILLFLVPGSMSTESTSQSRLIQP